MPAANCAGIPLLPWDGAFAGTIIPVTPFEGGRTRAGLVPAPLHRLSVCRQSFSLSQLDYIGGQPI